MISGVLVGNKVLVTKQEKQLFLRSYFGSETENGLELSLEEALFLKTKGRLNIINKKGKDISEKELIKSAERANKNFLNRYAVLKDLRNKGYVAKTALKYGGDFRVYDKGQKPGEDHARWILYVLNEHKNIDARQFAAISRVAHSVKKSLLLGIVDDENAVTYYESNWLKI